MSKTHEMEKFLNKLSKEMFGRERNVNCCVSCDSTEVKPEDFRDELSRKEFTLSNFCQKCQDSCFNKIGLEYIGEQDE